MIELYILFSGGKRGQRGGQTGAQKTQTEEHETARHTVSEKGTAALTQQFEDMSTTGVGGKVFEFSSCMSVNICASLIIFLLQNQIMRKDHISPHWKINCIDNYNLYNNTIYIYIYVYIYIYIYI